MLQAARLWWNDTLEEAEIAIRDSESALQGSVWRSIQCMPSRQSLCNLASSFYTSAGGAAATQTQTISRFLPNYPGPVFLSQRDSHLLPADVARMLGTGHCPESATGRTAIAPQHASDVQRHDISLCNVVGLGMDYVFVPFKNRLYALANPVGNVALLFMSLLIVYLMVVVGHNLQTVLGVSSLAPSADKDKVSACQKEHVHKCVHVCVCVCVCVFSDRHKKNRSAPSGQLHACWDFCCLLASPLGPASTQSRQRL